MPVHTYDPKNNVLTIDAVPMSGFADGTYITVTFDEDAFSKVVGADGEVSRAKSNNYSGSVVVTFMQTSMSNDVLSAIALLDKVSNIGVVVVQLKEIGTKNFVMSADGWIRKMPDITYSKDIENREWTLDLANLSVFIGGNPLPG